MRLRRGMLPVIWLETARDDLGTITERGSRQTTVPQSATLSGMIPSLWPVQTISTCNKNYSTSTPSNCAVCWLSTSPNKNSACTRRATRLRGDAALNANVVLPRLNVYASHTPPDCTQHRNLIIEHSPKYYGKALGQ